MAVHLIIGIFLLPLMIDPMSAHRTRIDKKKVTYPLLIDSTSNGEADGGHTKDVSGSKPGAEYAVGGIH